MSLNNRPAIQAPLAIPPLHAKDKILLRPLSELGKPTHQTGGYSFLRRTEYISSEQKARNEANASAAKAAARQTAANKSRKPIDASKEDPLVMLRAAVKGFDLAYSEDAYTGPDSTTNLRGSAITPAEKEAWNNPRHPTKGNVQLLEAYPFIPDLEAITDSGAYMILKFAANPTPVTDSHDARMDMALVRPPGEGAEEEKWEIFLPEDETVMKNARKRLDVNNSAKDDEALYTHQNKDGSSGTFKYPYLRAFEAVRSVEQPNQRYRQVAVALHDNDPEADLGLDVDVQEKGAYYYPVTAKYSLKPWRSKDLANVGVSSQKARDKSVKYDWMTLEIKEPNEVEAQQRHKHRMEIDDDDLMHEGEE